jgi:hypothetical protein
MSSCRQIFEEKANQQPTGVLVFNEPECKGEMTEIITNGQFSLSGNGKSFIVPENYKLRLHKDFRYVDYDHYLWGTYVDNTELSIDIWMDSFGIESRTSYDGIQYIEVESLGIREDVIASSCVGLHNPPLFEYEPGPINEKCENFLDSYCQSSRRYQIDVCNHRKMYFQPELESNHNGNLTESPRHSTLVGMALYICFFVIFGFVLTGMYESLQSLFPMSSSLP